MEDFIMKKFLALLVALVLVATALTGCGAGSEGGQKTIAVVAKGESHAFWQSVKAGAEAAAKENGYDVTFRGPASESAKDLPSQVEMVQTALSNNVNGLVLATIGTGFTDLLAQAFDKEIPVVQFDSGIWADDVAALDGQSKNPIQASVATSNTAAAGVAAENFYAYLKTNGLVKDGYKVGIIQHDSTATGIDRAGGFKAKIEELAKADGVTLDVNVQVKANNAGEYKLGLTALKDWGAESIFMTNEGVVKQVSDAIAAAGTKYDAIKFCGYDAGTKQIEWMKKTTGPKLVGAVAQDSFQIGYQAVEQAVFALEGKEITEKVDIAGAWWDATNVDEMIEKNLVYQG
jgi:ribose transport system substrate-binding protein